MALLAGHRRFFAGWWVFAGDGLADGAQALRAEGLDPDHPAVMAAIDLVRWELSLLAPGNAAH